ncbi:MAG: PH domain-containing protein [Clostridiales bacterium]|nr:PH domain-containing protein [Clostridiales bacterium]MBR5937714.1 PH domain-containing protein [Clostridiales bacterium]
MAKVDKLNDYIVEEQIIWKDKKRILGLPITFTKYSFSENRLFMEKGFFKVVKDELLMYRVLDVRLKKSFWQRIFKVGTIELSTADKSTPIILLENIKNPDRTRDALSSIAEKERDEKRVLGKEMFGTANDGAIAHDSFIE